MAGRLYGADIEQLRTLADLFDDRSSQLQTTAEVVGAGVDEVPWFGPSSEMFRDEWYGSHAPTLRAAVASLAQVAVRVRDNADAQEATSSTLDGPGPGGGAGGPAGPVGTGRPGGSAGGGNPASVVGDPGTGSSPGGELFDTLSMGLTATGLVVTGTRWDVMKMAPHLDDMPALRSASSFDDLGRTVGLLDDASSALNVLGVATGGYQFYAGMRDGDGYYAADGAVTAVLSGAAMIPGVNTVAAPAAAIWGGASLINGLVSDEPLTKNIADGVDNVKDFASDVGDFLGF